MQNHIFINFDPPDSLISNFILNCLEQYLIWFYDFVGPILKKKLEPFWLLKGEQCHIDYSFFDCPFYSTWHLPWKWFKIDVWYIGAGKEATWSDFCRTQRDTRSIPNVRAMAGRRTALQVFAVFDTVFNLFFLSIHVYNIICRFHPGKVSSSCSSSPLCFHPP